MTLRHVHKLLCSKLFSHLKYFLFLSSAWIRCQSSEYDLKELGALVLCFLFRVWVCISFHESIPLPVFHAPLCSGSSILEARRRHQSRIWNRCKYQALGRFVICYITYPANKVSLACRMPLLDHGKKYPSVARLR